MKVTRDGFKNRQLHIEDYLLMVSAEQKEQAEVFDYRRIAENNHTITDIWTNKLLDVILRRGNMNEAYKKVKSHRITVVFDGTTAPQFSQKRHRLKGISIIFSHIGETADAVIKKMAGRERQKALVVSSDRDIVQSAAACGAATVSSDEFENRLTMTMGMDGIRTGGNDYEGWKPTTKKKGPSRRLSRRQRKNIAKLRKL